MASTRAEIMQALENPTPNPLAEAVGDAVRRYGVEFAVAVRGNAGVAQIVRLTPPMNEIESVAFELLVQEVKATMPRATISTRYAG
jgi:hypothetical protein